MVVAASSVCEMLRSGGKRGRRIVVRMLSWNWMCMLNSTVWLNKNLSQQKPPYISSVLYAN